MVIGFKAEKSEGTLTYTEGNYVAKIASIELKTSSAMGSDFFRIKYVGDGFVSIFGDIYDNFFGRHLLYQLYTALGIDTDRTDVDESELIGSYVTISIKKRKNKDGSDYLYNDKPQFQVAEILPADSDFDDDSDDDDSWAG